MGNGRENGWVNLAIFGQICTLPQVKILSNRELSITVHFLLGSLCHGENEKI
jgi:hypothetical protein